MIAPRNGSSEFELASKRPYREIRNLRRIHSVLVMRETPNSLLANFPVPKRSRSETGSLDTAD
jgi:hypothetical protein